MSKVNPFVPVGLHTLTTSDHGDLNDLRYRTSGKFQYEDANGILTLRCSSTRCCSQCRSFAHTVCTLPTQASWRMHFRFTICRASYALLRLLRTLMRTDAHVSIPIAAASPGACENSSSSPICTRPSPHLVSCPYRLEHHRHQLLPCSR